MQSPIETAMAMQTDFGTTDIMEQQQGARTDDAMRCQDAQVNRLAIMRMERKYEHIMKKVCNGCGSYTDLEKFNLFFCFCR